MIGVEITSYVDKKLLVGYFDGFTWVKLGGGRCLFSLKTTVKTVTD